MNDLDAFNGEHAGVPGLGHALIALGFFRSRHQRQPRFKRARRRSNKRQTVSCYKSSTSLARDYIKRARSAGWRGSIRKIILSLAAPKPSTGTLRIPNRATSLQENETQAACSHTATV